MDARVRYTIRKELKMLQREQETTGQSYDAARFLMTATCPPSTSIYSRGGWIADQPFMAGWGSIWYRPSRTYDLSTWSDTRRDFTFDNPYWYTYWWITERGASFIWAYAIYYYTTWTGPKEWETAGEAEQAALADFAAWPYPPWQYGTPGAIIIFRNNGNTAESRQWQPIDPVNRGRSYIYRTHRSLAPIHEI